MSGKQIRATDSSFGLWYKNFSGPPARADRLEIVNLKRKDGPSGVATGA
jgi:hypothetical protein